MTHEITDIRRNHLQECVAWCVFLGIVSMDFTAS